MNFALHLHPGWALILCALVACLPATHAAARSPGSAADDKVTARASSTAEGFHAAGAVDGDRFSTHGATAWQGRPAASIWWWEARFESPRRIGAILQLIGDHPFVLRNAPRSSVWQGTKDGTNWFDLTETAVRDERRLFRVHRLKKDIVLLGLRLSISSVTGNAPTLREIEFYGDRHASISFPDWIAVVNTTHESALPGHGQEFIPLAQSCPGWSQLEAQQVWLTAFDERFLEVEPRPICAFLSGSFKDWCEVDRKHWRGTEHVLRSKRLPLWASCGGAQGLALLWEYGTTRAWDCPHCRNPFHPKTPLYTHIGHTAERPCGDYSACVFERGPHAITTLLSDPVFAGLPREFEVMESHCGQIEQPPSDWVQLATGGPGTRTAMQCLRLGDRPIYAAQFHIEMSGTPAVSRTIMGNFLRVAKTWQQQPQALILPIR